MDWPDGLEYGGASLPHLFEDLRLRRDFDISLCTRLGAGQARRDKKQDGIVPGNSSSANFLFRLVSKPSQVCSEECLFAFKPAGVPTEC